MMMMMMMAVLSDGGHILCSDERVKSKREKKRDR
jgi:hypothetical protein